MMQKEKLTPEQVEYLRALAKLNGGDPVDSISARQIAKLRDSGLADPQWLMKKGRQIAPNEYTIPEWMWQAAGLDGDDETKVTSAPAHVAASATSLDIVESAGIFPENDPFYEPDGCYPDLIALFKSRIWHPLWIVGPTGCGKTLAVEQACAATGREYFRIQITRESDEAKLLGSSQLIDGNTRFAESAVIAAMRRGGVLLLDEIDHATDKADCLRPILEGKSVYLTRARRMIHAAEGFQVVATANTKGRGDDSGEYVGTQIINEAFLDRIGGSTIEHDYPIPTKEYIILSRRMKARGLDDDKYVIQLINWAHHCRKNKKAGVIAHFIATRRLCSIIDAYAIWGKSVALKRGIGIYEDATASVMEEYFHLFDNATKLPDLTDPNRW